MASDQNSEGEHYALFEAILNLKTVSEAAKFFEDLCTPVELKEMSERWRVVSSLKENIPYRKIHELTGVSVTTIGRVARSIKFGSGGYDLVFKRMSKRNGKKVQTYHSNTKKRSVK